MKMAITILNTDRALLIETLELVRELARGRLTLTSELYHDHAIMDKQQLHQILKDNVDDLLQTLKFSKLCTNEPIITTSTEA